ncbi:unnamed protein product [Brassicogethes aeneus]|uniref:Uncharacterized protein n=1 Tax=Brassicogethes aeneus TaxID=1431903 RepID=A0A9P0BJ32_BRAAE|nr:unnamed protein product [Brassicogethes aeneus]
MVDSLSKQLAAQTGLLTRQGAQIEELNTRLAQFMAANNHEKPTNSLDVLKQTSVTETPKLSNCNENQNDGEPINKRKRVHSDNAQTGVQDFPALPTKNPTGYYPPEQLNTQLAAPTANTQDVQEEIILNYTPPTDDAMEQESTSTEQTTQSQQNTTTQPKIPPIVLRTKKRWTLVSNVFKAKGWHFNKAINTADGIKFFPDSIESFRSITGFLQHNKEQFHTYLLPEEKLLQVVIRGLPLEIDLEELT